MRNNKGISLIVLVITIIIMIILAGAVVLTLNNTGILDKASNVVEQTNIATIKEITQVAWVEAYANGARSEQDLKTAVDNVLAKNKITEDMYKNYTIKVTTSGVEFIYEDPRLNHGGIIPEGGIYITNASIIVSEMYGCDVYDYTTATTYNAGDAFPELKYGDKYIYGDFIYVYNADPNVELYAVDTNINGWYVEYNSSNKNAGIILEKINGSNVTSMQNTFRDNETVQTITNIPATIKNMEWAFAGTNIKSVPDIPEGVEHITQAFTLSTLEKAPVIPSSVINMDYVFSNCASLVGTITINTNTKNFTGCFTSVDMSKITLAGKCRSELKQEMADTGVNGDQVTIID